MKKEFKPTEKQKANLFVKGDPRISKGVKRSMEERTRRKRWREEKQFSAARKLESYVTLGDRQLVLKGYDTKRDLQKAEQDIIALLHTLANCTVIELAAILSMYQKQ